MNRLKLSVLLCLLCLPGLAILSGCGMVGKGGPLADTTSVGYSPMVGDVVFQSMPPTELSTAIETATNSPYSHCGVVAIKNDA
jgi:hypothetical protein